MTKDYQRWGLTKSFYIQVMNLAGKYLGLHLYWVNRRPLQSAPVPSLPPGLSVRVLTAADLYTAAMDPQLEITHAFIDAALTRGDMAFGVFAKEKLVSYLWRATGLAPHVDGLWVRVAPQYRYGYKAFTHPAYRGQELNIVAATLSDQAYLAKGYTEHISFIETHNFPSLAMNKKKQDVEQSVGLAGYIKNRFLTINFRTPGCKSVGFAFYLPQHEERLNAHPQVVSAPSLSSEDPRPLPPIHHE